MAAAFDVKKAQRELYVPPTRPVIADVPAMTFLMADGAGDPNDADGEFARAVGALYALSYTIRMSPRSGSEPKGYFDYVVAPLEGLWTFPLELFDGVHVPTQALSWTAMIRQPEFVTAEVLEWARAAVAAKKPQIDTAPVRRATWTEGLTVQMLHLGPYATEPESLARMHSLAAKSGYAIDLSDVRLHHEIYLSDPGRTSPEKLRTVLRHPIRPV